MRRMTWRFAMSSCSRILLLTVFLYSLRFAVSQPNQVSLWYTYNFWSSRSNLPGERCRSGFCPALCQDIYIESIEKKLCSVRIDIAIAQDSNLSCRLFFCCLLVCGGTCFVFSAKRRLNVLLFIRKFILNFDCRGRMFKTTLFIQ